MPRTHSKPQQQTLSIRVSESLREFLELSRQVIANGQGDSVSISDVAKVLLESARADRLDFRLEVAELQQSPTAALGQIRRKWEQQQPLSRAEWVLLAHYIQVACENLSGNTTIPSADSFIAVLEALLAVRSLRNDRGSGLDRFYLGNLAVPVGDQDVPVGGWKKILSALQQIPRPPLLVVTSRLADDHLWAEVLNLGGHDVLATPFRANELVWVLENAWRRYGFTLGAKAMAACATLC